MVRHTLKILQQSQSNIYDVTILGKSFTIDICQVPKRNPEITQYFQRYSLHYYNLLFVKNECEFSDKKLSALWISISRLLFFQSVK